MALFVEGKHYNRKTEFKKGNIPWNKGQTYFLTGWSRKFKECRDCESKKKRGRGRHYAQGYCKGCYHVRFKKKAAQIEKQKIRSRRRWERVMQNPELHQAYLERQKLWRKNSKSFLKSYERKKKVYRFQKFIRTFFEEKRTVRGYKRLLTVTVEHGSKEYKVPMPFSRSIIEGRDFEVFKREVKKYLQKSYPQILDNQGLDNDPWHRV